MSAPTTPRSVPSEPARRPVVPTSELPELQAPGRAALARAWKKQRVGVIALALGLVVLVCIAAALVDRVVHDGKVLPGVEAGGVDLSGKSERDAQHALEAKAKQLESGTITVRAGKQQLGVQAAVIGLHVDVPATVRAARRAGRSGNLFAQVAGTALRRSRNEQVPLVITVNDDAFEGALDGWVTATGHGLVDGGLRFQGARVTEIVPKDGTGISRTTAAHQVMAALAAGTRDAGTLHVGPTTPPIDAHDVAEAAAQARRVLSAPTTVSVSGHVLALQPAQVGAALGTQIVGSKLHLHVDADKLRLAFGPALAGVEIAPRDAGFDVNGTAVSVVPSVVGHQIDAAQVGSEIASGQHAITATLHYTQPARTTEWARKLNITELVSTFTTHHKCCAPRVTNIHRAADVINGTIVLPGQTFSLNNALGQRTLEKGYVSAPQIGADLEDEDAVGGGVSQVSTTLYNATFFGCYQDVTHTVHALWLSRYPMGREATLNYPSIDNRFRNDSHSGLLIRTSYSSTSITVSFYGNKEGRSCHGVGPDIQKTIPSPTVYVTDPSLPHGSQRVVESGATGYVVENDRIIDTPGKPEKRERYVERYSATPTKIARGP